MALSDKDKSGIKIIAGSVGVLIMLAVLAVLARDPRSYDEDSLCPTDNDYAHTIVLIDKTDPITESQERRTKNLLKDLKRSLAVRDKLSVFVLDDTNYLAPAPVFSKCSPGSGDDANALYQNPKMLQTRFDDTFGAELDQAFQSILNISEAARSPILEMIREVSFIADFEPGRRDRRLIIVSDMMHNMPAYSHYRDGIDYAAFQDRAYAAETRADLTGVTVEILYLWRARGNGPQGRRHVGFWEDYFRIAGARLKDVRRVP